MPQATFTADQLVFDDSAPSFQTDLVWVKGETNRTHLQNLLATAGVNPESVFPCNTETTFILLRGIGYRVDYKYFQYALHRHYLKPVPRKQGNRHVWDEKHVLAFSDHLEEIRRWEYGHPAHLHKLSPKERAEHTVEVLRRKASYEAYLSMTVPDLLNLVSQEESRERREQIVCAIKELCGVLHVRGNEQYEPPTPVSN